MVTMSNSQIDLAQQEFDQKYITSSEIMKDLSVSRGTILYARRTGKLPHAVSLNNGTLFIWERSIVQPYLDAWKIILNARRGD
jgi:hypothetical protein